MKEKLELKNVKGVNDYLPDEQVIRERIINTLKNNFYLYGFLPLETSILMHFDVLASKYAGGSEILKEVYRLNDQGDRQLGLRYDLTVPFCKVIGMEKNLSLPFRRFEIGKVFRDGPVKPGRDREFYQCDIDVCGISSIECEIEMFTMAKKIYDELNLNVNIHFNNRKFLMGIMAYCNISEDLYSRVILTVDKLDKIGKDGVYKELESYNISIDKINLVFDLLDHDFNYYKDNFSNTDIVLLKEGINELDIIINYINELKMDYCLFKPFLARGLEIYTGTVFEVFDSTNKMRSALGGGGRYDKIITNFINDGNEYPAVGMSFGLEPIYQLIKMNENEETPLIDVIIYPFDMNPQILKIANELRLNNLKVLVELNHSKLKKTLDIANRQHIPYVLIIGEDELLKKEYTLKIMNEGKQICTTLDNIIKEIKK